MSRRQIGGMTKRIGSDHDERYAIAGLKRRRTALLGEIAETEAKAQTLIIALGHIDATLTLLQPEILLEALPQHPNPPRVKRGENTRPILSCLHQAGRPMSTQALARALLIARGKPAIRVGREAKEAARQVMRQMVRAGTARKVNERGDEETWDLVRDQ